MGNDKVSREGLLKILQILEKDQPEDFWAAIRMMEGGTEDPAQMPLSEFTE